jgi:8-oxo-dGTP diphosphatase
MAGLWEFPGGKVEDGETVLEALARELREELGIEPTSAEPLFCVRHTYPEWEVVLDIWCVRSFRGEPAALEGQKVAWVPLTEVKTLEFPAANQPIVDWLSTLPRP